MDQREPLPDEGNQAWAEQGLREQYEEWATDPRTQAEYMRWQIEAQLQDLALMGITATKGAGTDFKQVPPGNHLARLYQVIDIGTQRGEYLGEATVRHQIIMRWELPLETEEFEGEVKPMIVSRFYTLSVGDKAHLRHDLEAWLARPLTAEEILHGYDVTKLIGKCCMVQVVHNDKGKAQVKSVGSVPKGMEIPPAFNKQSYFSLERWDDAAFAALPKGFQKIIMESDEYKDLNSKGDTPAAKTTPAAGSKADGVDDDDIPF